jgi:hypothetical protein
MVTNIFVAALYFMHGKILFAIWTDQAIETSIPAVGSADPHAGRSQDVFTSFD